MVADHDRLQELARLISREHHYTTELARRSLESAFLIGSWLTEVRDELKKYNLSWSRWIEENCEFGTCSARSYVRLATYQAEIPEHLGINDAILYIRGLPPASSGIGVALPPEVREEAERLLQGGMSHAAVARALDISAGTVTDWATGRTERRNKRDKVKRRAKKARKALKREQAAKNARSAGGNISKGYSLIRQAIQEIDRARVQEKGEKKQHLDQCLYRLNAAEDEIGKALRS